ncbi:uncharacterized protein MYCFIDRAFT_206800 [Pseudocercospora fijiensis CIRAD86]|uniref:Uncharacterized protein n=1 Tax=Pseudocercospora fijiensis (strain CIRAD86) TaxID=383855 RepID=M3A5G4_PSEFD|nr:uncharacterized protein MYCFIDRAFT_206800 [Pseudocercospora fijiensis CIRAD86]EME86369.1 hypothetical protein MYCFIDRAFT_206800 [Pseudocercospora fijiensis CIRAD86]
MHLRCRERVIFLQRHGATQNVGRGEVQNAPSVFLQSVMRFGFNSVLAIAAYGDERALLLTKGVCAHHKVPIEDSTKPESLKHDPLFHVQLQETFVDKRVDLQAVTTMQFPRKEQCLFSIRWAAERQLRQRSRHAQRYAMLQSSAFPNEYTCGTVSPELPIGCTSAWRTVPAALPTHTLQGQGLFPNSKSSGQVNPRCRDKLCAIAYVAAEGQEAMHLEPINGGIRRSGKYDGCLHTLCSPTANCCCLAVNDAWVGRASAVRCTLQEPHPGTFMALNYSYSYSGKFDEAAVAQSTCTFAESCHRLSPSKEGWSRSNVCIALAVVQRLRRPLLHSHTVIGFTQRSWGAGAGAWWGHVDDKDQRDVGKSFEVGQGFRALASHPGFSLASLPRCTILRPRGQHADARVYSLLMLHSGITHHDDKASSLGARSALAHGI